MATWFEIIYTGEPTEADYQRVSELAAEGFTSGQLINDDEPHPFTPASDSAWCGTCGRRREDKHAGHSA
jgi:hypothetical protein